MKTTTQQRNETPSPVTMDAPLLPQWAFVVQFRSIPGGSALEAGRLEHLTSGRTVHFQSLAELTTYLTQELRATSNV